MALFSECRPQCAQTVLDTADIVREGDFTTAIPDGAGPMGPTTPKVLEGYTYCELHLKLKRKAQPAVL